jgi:hypothetical protein
MIERLSRFVLNETNIELNCKMLEARPIVRKKEPVTTTLFWCIYQLIYPEQMNPGFQEEQAFKFSSIEKWRENHTYKTYRIKANEAEQALLQSPTRETIQLLCDLYQINVVVVYEHYYYDYTGHGDGPIHYIFKTTGYYVGDPVDLTKKLSVDPVKPLYAISHYTLPTLQEMATLLGLSGTTKTDLYDKIKRHLDI